MLIFSKMTAYLGKTKETHKDDKEFLGKLTDTFKSAPTFLPTC